VRSLLRLDPTPAVLFDRTPVSAAWRCPSAPKLATLGD
jgi:hypothetical protein